MSREGGAGLSMMKGFYEGGYMGSGKGSGV